MRLLNCPWFRSPPYQGVSRVARYEYLLGVVSNNVLAKLAGVTLARVADIRKRRELERGFS